MRFALIIGTLNRPEAIASCLKSIFEQTWQDYEIIIIDQSNNRLTEEYIRSLKDKRIKYKHVDYKGISKARNDALEIADADFFCLIDDDAYYDKEYLSIANCMLKDERTILSGYIYDTIKQGPFAQYSIDNEGKDLNVRSILRTCPSAALIFPICVRDDVGLFDEQFGVGAKYGSGEESDLLLRCLESGYKVKYIHKMKLSHPVPISKTKRKISADKLASYYKGLGALYKKHLINRKTISLRGCYIEIWIKLIVKKCMPFMYDIKEINKLIYGFKEGLNSYKES